MSWLRVSKAGFAGLLLLFAGASAFADAPYEGVVKKRDDYPEMPPQNYLSAEVRMAAAEYMLSITK